MGGLVNPIIFKAGHSNFWSFLGDNRNQDTKNIINTLSERLFKKRERFFRNKLFLTYWGNKIYYLANNKIIIRINLYNSKPEVFGYRRNRYINKNNKKLTRLDKNWHVFVGLLRVKLNKYKDKQRKRAKLMHNKSMLGDIFLIRDYFYEIIESQYFQQELRLERLKYACRKGLLLIAIKKNLIITSPAIRGETIYQSTLALRIFELLYNIKRLLNRVNRAKVEKRRGAFLSKIENMFRRNRNHNFLTTFLILGYNSINKKSANIRIKNQLIFYSEFFLGLSPSKNAKLIKHKWVSIYNLIKEQYYLFKRRDNLYSELRIDLNRLLFKQYFVHNIFKFNNNVKITPKVVDIITKEFTFLSGIPFKYMSHKMHVYNFLNFSILFGVRSYDKPNFNSALSKNLRKMKLKNLKKVRFFIKKLKKNLKLYLKRYNKMLNWSWYGASFNTLMNKKKGIKLLNLIQRRRVSLLLYSKTFFHVKTKHNLLSFLTKMLNIKRIDNRKVKFRVDDLNRQIIKKLRPLVDFTKCKRLLHFNFNNFNYGFNQKDDVTSRNFINNNKKNILYLKKGYRQLLLSLKQRYKIIKVIPLEKKFLINKLFLSFKRYGVLSNLVNIKTQIYVILYKKIKLTKRERQRLLCFFFLRSSYRLKKGLLSLNARMLTGLKVKKNYINEPILSSKVDFYSIIKGKTTIQNIKYYKYFIKKYKNKKESRHLYEAVVNSINKRNIALSFLHYKKQKRYKTLTFNDTKTEFSLSSIRFIKIKYNRMYNYYFFYLIKRLNFIFSLFKFLKKTTMYNSMSNSKYLVKINKIMHFLLNIPMKSFILLKQHKLLKMRKNFLFFVKKLIDVNNHHIEDSDHFVSVLTNFIRSKNKDYYLKWSKRLLLKESMYSSKHYNAVKKNKFLVNDFYVLKLNRYLKKFKFFYFFNKSNKFLLKKYYNLFFFFNKLGKRYKKKFIKKKKENLIYKALNVIDNYNDNKKKLIVLLDKKRKKLIYKIKQRIRKSFFKHDLFFKEVLFYRILLKNLTKLLVLKVKKRINFILLLRHYYKEKKKNIFFSNLNKSSKRIQAYCFSGYSFFNKKLAAEKGINFSIKSIKGLSFIKKYVNIYNYFDTMSLKRGLINPKIFLKKSSLNKVDQKRYYSTTTSLKNKRRKRYERYRNLKEVKSLWDKSKQKSFFFLLYLLKRKVKRCKMNKKKSLLNSKILCNKGKEYVSNSYNVVLATKQNIYACKVSYFLIKKIFKFFFNFLQRKRVFFYKNYYYLTKDHGYLCLVLLDISLKRKFLEKNFSKNNINFLSLIDYKNFLKKVKNVI